MRKMTFGWLAGLLGALALAGAAQAQQRIGGATGGTGGTGGFSGSSSTGFSGSSTGFTGSGSASGSTGFTGSTTSFTGGGATSGAGRAGASTYGTTSIIGRFYGNPLSAGLGAPTTTSGAGGAGSTTLPAVAGIRPFPTQLQFGTPVYDQAAITRSQQQGTLGGQGGLGTGLGGLGSTTSGLGTGRTGVGVGSGVGRAPQYLTYATFGRTPDNAVPGGPGGPGGGTAVSGMAGRVPELQGVIAQSEKLPSRDRIRVGANDRGEVVLRGQVGSEREKRLAEAMIRLSPGIRDIRNELQVTRSR